MTQRRWLPALLLGLTVTLLAGCSTTRVVEGQVQSFSTLAAVPAPATYRIERLPSQQAPSFDPIATTDRKFNRMRPSMARVLGLETRSAKEG